jgi:hypothetical protein
MSLKRISTQGRSQRSHSVKQCRYLHGQNLILQVSNCRDVAIVFHSHCLSPFRFFTDINRRGEGLWNKDIAFPLERLYTLIANGVWSDPVSEFKWMGVGKAAPYQLWESDPASGSVLRLQDVEMRCPWCSVDGQVPLTEFCLTHTTKKATSRCSSCGQRFNADTLSAKFLKNDLDEFIERKRNGW